MEAESDNDVESETEPDTETESLCYGECQCESDPLTKENKGKENNGNIQFIRKVPTHPRNFLKRKAKHCEISLSIINNFSRCQQKKANYLLNHYKSSYGINEKDEELRKLIERDHGMRQFFIFKRICEIAVNNFVVSQAKWYHVEIDTEQNEKLIIDITTNLITQVRGNREVETKRRSGYKLSSQFITIRVFK